MLQTAKVKLLAAPTPMAGLALGIASLGWCWENFADIQGYGQLLGALLASVLLLVLTVKYLIHSDTLKADLAHPVVGSVVPTFAMALMVVSNALGHYSLILGDSLWLVGLGLHVVFLVTFIYHRAKDFELHHMVPSWFVPPVGIIVADVSFSGTGALSLLANSALIFGMLAYAVMLPMMIYRLMFTHEVPDAAKPTIAILAAPASLSLAGYLTVTASPSPLIVALLFGIGVLMTAIIYLAFFKLLQLPFSPGYAAFTFPMVIGATALFKMIEWMQSIGMASQYIQQVQLLATIELTIATLAVSYVAIRYAYFFNGQRHLTV
ncbi:C4-dicarboxylate ABC transporter [Shewanella sp. UCD-FRSSP16_17]|uniref:TDT family transporter n=1 Tax=unclassified Shewanella TaxID=196818 RepID=UPI0007EEE3DF|nr:MULTISPECIES: TDT family transporter [unclassified Shewanella]MBQ4891530.1 TDT family transporter [Shewanella sp. MMG014]OBT07157.1 C4-dicarboxylate ABC transporter [Shewanella sp. UCD-FRSSP16_17]